MEKVAALAYLKLSSEELKSFEKQFKEILAYVDQIQEVPMSAEEAKSMGAFHIQTAFYKQMGLSSLESFREDQSNDEGQKLLLSNEEALQNASKKSGLPQELLFEVPSIIERNEG